MWRHRSKWRQGICRGALFVTLAPGLIAGPVLATGFVAEEAGGDVVRVVPRLHCEAPATLRLRRFEDGSAQLLCAARPIARVSVPG